MEHHTRGCACGQAFNGIACSTSDLGAFDRDKSGEPPPGRVTDRGLEGPTLREQLGGRDEHWQLRALLSPELQAFRGLMAQHQPEVGSSTGGGFGGVAAQSRPPPGDAQAVLSRASTEGGVAEGGDGIHASNVSRGTHIPTYVYVEHTRSHHELVGPGSGGEGAEPHSRKNVNSVAVTLPECFRTRAWRLVEGLYPYQRKRIKTCHRACLGGSVAVELRSDAGKARAYFRGLTTCGSVWECPLCSMRIRTERALEIQRAVATWGPARTLLLTLTIRHGMGEDLKHLRSNVAECWRRVRQHRGWRRMQDTLGYVGDVRTLELTHGYNGWHPHLHLLLFVEHPERVVEVLEELSNVWASTVERVLGVSNVPDSKRGVSIVPCRDGTYLTKMGVGFELTAADSKIGAKGHRSPWQIASDVVELHRPKDIRLWTAYCDGIRGARMLTWGGEIRYRVGLKKEKTDEEIASAEPDAEKGVVVGLIAKAVWAQLCRVPMGRRRLLAAVEAGGWDAAQEYLARAAPS